MKTFKDDKKREWTIEITSSALKRIRSLAEVDLLDAVNGKELLRKLATDYGLLVDVVYAAVKPQADAKEVTDEDFGRSMRGQAISDATDALIEDFADFLPPHQSRPLTKAYGKIAKGIKKGWAMAEKGIDELDLDGELDKALSRSGEFSTSSRESPG